MENQTIAYHTLPGCPEKGYLVEPTDAEVPVGFERVVPVVLACNESYAPYASVTVQSMLENAGTGCFYRVFVLHAGLTDDTIRLLESAKAPQLTVRCLNVEPLMESKGAELHVNGYFSKEAYFRLLIPEALSVYSQVVYLDCDIVVNRDIADILPPDMGDNLFAAVRDRPWSSRYVAEQLHVKEKNYFNSGVLVINVGRWNAEKTTEKCFAYIRTARPEQLRFVDQDVLNVVCMDRVLYLDDAWNYLLHVLLRPNPERQSYAEQMGENFYVLHFTGRLKPWSHPELPLSRYFWKYAKNSAFFERIVETMGKTAAEELTKQKSEKDRLKKDLAKKTGEVEKLKKKNARLQHDLDCVHKSVSFRIGRAITFVPRKIRGGVRCFREHGAAYTFDRALVHLRIKK